MVEVVSENFNKFREDTVPNVYLENDVIFDRSDLLRNTFNIKLPTGNLEQIVESLEKKLKSKRFTEADATVDEMVQGYVGDLPEYQTPEVINFLDEYINAKAPVEDIFEKYLKS